MPRTSPVRPRWTIGQFSRMTRLSARMLRHYDRLGLLRPGGVDPFNRRCAPGLPGKQVTVVENLTL